MTRTLNGLGNIVAFLPSDLSNEHGLLADLATADWPSSTVHEPLASYDFFPCFPQWNGLGKHVKR